MRDVYLINLSFGLAGTERRFANIWHTLRKRGRVRPILVVPETLAELLYQARLATPGDELLWIVKDPPIFRRLSQLRLGPRRQMLLAALRSRVVARTYGWVWDRVRQDPSAIIHVGLNCSALNPADAPIVYEAVDSNLTQLRSRHYIKAAARPSIIHCQTERIRVALEAGMSDRRPIWTTVTSPCYFAAYPDRQQTPVPRDRTLIAFVGRLAPEKNPLLFVEAVARLRQTGVACRALILGEGPSEAAVAARVQELGLSDVVEMGFSQRPSDRLLEASVYVSLQPGDNYGSQSLLEAMGAGCAIVATNAGETRRLIIPDVGVLVDADVGQLTTALGDLLADPVGTAAMGTAAATLARTQYTADVYCEFLESLYARAVECHAGAREPTAEPAAERTASAPHSS